MDRAAREALRHALRGMPPGPTRTTGAATWYAPGGRDRTTTISMGVEHRVTVQLRCEGQDSLRTAPTRMFSAGRGLCFGGLVLGQLASGTRTQRHQQRPPRKPSGGTSANRSMNPRVSDHGPRCLSVRASPATSSVVASLLPTSGNRSITIGSASISSSLPEYHLIHAVPGGRDSSNVARRSRAPACSTTSATPAATTARHQSHDSASTAFCGLRLALAGRARSCGAGTVVAATIAARRGAEHAVAALDHAPR